MLFIVIINKKLPSFVPCGLSPFTGRSEEKEDPTVKIILLPFRKAWTMASDSVRAPESARARMHVEWSKRLNALLKLIESRDTADSFRSNARRIFCQQSMRKWLVPQPLIPRIGW